MEGQVPENGIFSARVGVGLCRVVDMDRRECLCLSTDVKTALAAAPLSWFRGGPTRAMGHFGE